MTTLSFNLRSSTVRFSGGAESDGWGLTLTGECERFGNLETFTIQGENGSWSGFGADVRVDVNLRPSRAEAAGIPANTPWVSDDDSRDIIRVTCPGEGIDRLLLQISIWLPADAFQRLANVDWAAQEVTLFVVTPWSGAESPFSLDGPRGEVWRTAVRPYACLHAVNIYFSPAVTQKVGLEDQPSQANADDEKSATQVQPILDSVERATATIGELRATIVKVAWALAVVMVVTAFIR